jgi:hypothetical protein
MTYGFPSSRGMRRWVQVNSFSARLAIGQHKAIVFLADVLPAQRQDFVSARPCKCEHANGSNCPRRGTLIALRLAQSVTESRQLSLA